MARPLLDVTEVLIDPMFQDTEIWVTRITETVDTSGIGQFSSAQTKFSGVVVQNRGEDLKRLPDGSRHGGSIEIYTQTNLISGEYGRTADEILWEGQTYTVTKVLDWSTYGRGFKHAFCDVLPLTPPGP